MSGANGLRIAMASLTLSLAGPSLAQSAESSLRITHHGSQEAVRGAANHFSGVVQVELRFASEFPARVSGGLVSFEPGARTVWHTHPLGQTLFVTRGLGLVQRWGGSVQEMRPGDVVWIPAGVKHWHGASHASAMSHLAIAEQLDGKTVDWLEPVADAVPAQVAAPGAIDALTAKQQAIAAVAAFAAMSDMPRLNAALNQGLDAGLTVSEAKEILVQLYAYVGFPKSLNALGELLKVTQGRQQRGIHDAAGREPVRPIPVGEELLAVGALNQARIAGGAVKNAVTDFAPLINQYLQAHLFGAIFERDNLDWASRELATVGALAATPGVEAQLRSHLRASLRVGLTAAQLRQLTQVLAERVDPAAAGRAEAALNQALAAATGG
jgi:quercetin dioxygenase-like cupin family protein